MKCKYVENASKIARIEKNKNKPCKVKWIYVYKI